MRASRRRQGRLTLLSSGSLLFSHFPAVAHIREDLKMAVSNNHRAGRKMSSEPPMNGVQKGRLEMRLCNPQDNATTSTRTYASFRCADALGHGNLTMPHR
jgi:hypothetical protein